MKLAMPYTKLDISQNKSTKKKLMRFCIDVYHTTFMKMDPRSISSCMIPEIETYLLGK